jgi:hypothetical protein
MDRRPATPRWITLSVAVYALLMTVLVATMIIARQSSIHRLSAPESLASWREWRNDVQQQQGQSAPVQRRVPESQEPPALVMWRDYFAIMLIAAVVFISVLYWIIVWFLRGMLTAQPVSGPGAD